MNQKTDTPSTPSHSEKEAVETSSMKSTKNQTEQPSKWKKVRETAKDIENDKSKDLDEAISGLNSETISKEQFEQAAKAYIELQKENEVLKTKLEEAEKARLYALAEQQTTATRHRNDLDKERKYAVSQAILSFAGLLDSLEVANLQNSEASLEQLKEGTQNILDLIHSIFKKLGVTEINSAVGEAFDPNRHSAVATEISEDPNQPADVIIKVLRKGYQLHERVLRPAMVIISQAKE